jgi:hypothetical protein
MRLLPRACVLATVLPLAFATTLLAVPAADARPGPAHHAEKHHAQHRSRHKAKHRSRHRAEPRLRASVTFTKNRADPFDGTVTWRVWKHVKVPAPVAVPGAPVSAPAQKPIPRTTKATVKVPRVWKLVEQRSWRAGSGLGGARGKDPCAHNVGWLPNGSYRAKQVDDYGGNVIKGRVFNLGQHACGRGTVRHNLFIHTETGAGNKQCRNTKGDQACRWEWPAINDYRSYGCIKMSPRDLAALTRAYHRHFHAGRTYASFRVHVVG